MAKDDTYWYNVGWPRLVKRACFIACRCPHRDISLYWIERTLWPALQHLPDGAGDAINCLLGEPRRLLDSLQRQQSLDDRRLAGCLQDYLWEQKLHFQGDASADRLSVWQAIRDRMWAHFPAEIDWSKEQYQRELLTLLNADPRQDLPRKLTTLQDYIWRFQLRPEPGMMLDLSADDTRQFLAHLGDISETIMMQLVHCLGK